MNDEVYFCYVEKHRNSLHLVDFTILDGRILTYLKYPKQEVYISLQYLEKTMGDEVVLLPADKHESFLHDDAIILDWHNQAYSKYSNNNFAISL